jgi:ketosteroid isomerase-like protein
MSQENVDVVRRLYEAHGGPKFDAVTEEVYDPEIEWHASEGFGVLHGRPAVLGHLKDFANAFDDWQVVPVELIDANTEVVAVNHASGTGKGSGVSLDAHYAVVYSFHASKIVLVREYATRAEALEAVGLAE